jgi:hypothetical protein
MNLRLLRKYCIEKIRKYPMLKDEISDHFFLAKDEVEEGGSELHECSVALLSVQYIKRHDRQENYHEKRIKELELELKLLKGE